MSKKPGKKLTVRHFRQCKDRGERIVALSVYDATTARLAAACGVELLLVGDSLGMTVLGYDNTIPVTLAQSLHHCTAVARGAGTAFVVGDMPFMTYQPSIETALVNAARYLQEARVDGVKLEGGRHMAPTVERLVLAGVPVMGHIGLLPQNVLTAGGYRIAGKTEEEAARLRDDARALADAGAFSLVLEGIPADVARTITDAVPIPTIGIGAGPGCDGQIQVVNDILGLFTDFVPKHAKRYADLDRALRDTFSAYTDDVRNGTFPGPEHSN
jgi:3-methyl-2-oxobutanoate hydroxymethyltransferase